MKIAGRFDSAMPPLSGEERQQLREDIEREGRITMPIVAQASSGLIVDGWNRWEIAQELGLQEGDGYRIQWEDWDDDKAADKAVSLNCQRREMSREQKRALAVELRGQGWTQARIGKAIGVKQQTLSDWMRKPSNTSPDVTEIGNVNPSSPIPSRPVPIVSIPPVPREEEEKTTQETATKADREANRNAARLAFVIDRVGRRQPAQRKTFTPDEREAAVARLRAGESVEQVASDVGASTGAVYVWARGAKRGKEWSVEIAAKPLSVLLERIARYWTPPPIDRWDWSPDSVATSSRADIAAAISRLEQTAEVCTGLVGRLRSVLSDESERGA